MLIAIPMRGDVLDQHFGHCEEFAFVEVDPKSKEVLSIRKEAAPVHQHGILPPWLKQRGATHVIAGGVGAHARALLESAEITLTAGAPSEDPADLVHKFLNGTLQSVDRVCEHRCQH